MILTQSEFVEIVGPHVSAIQEWHRSADRRRNDLRVEQAPAFWNAQDPATQGRIFTNLVKSEARDDEAEGRQFVRRSGVDLVEVLDNGRIAARLRFRTVQLGLDDNGSVRPIIPAPQSQTALEWFANHQLRTPWQPTLEEDAASGFRRPTNLLVGNTRDPVTDDLNRIVVCCHYRDNQISWWMDLDELGDIPGTASLTDGGGDEPDLEGPISISVKGDDQ